MSDSPELIEDRCFRSSSGELRDLVTGRPATIRPMPLAGRDAAGWLDACGRLARYWRPGEPALLDFGRSARGDGFEILEGSDELGEASGSGRRGGPNVVLQPRAAERLLVELIDEPCRRVRLVNVIGPWGAGVRTTLRLVSAAVRARGVVPVGLPVLSGWPQLRRSLRDRSIVVIAAEPDVVEPAIAVDLLLCGAWPLAVLRASRDVGGSEGVRLDPLPVERLLAMCPDADVDRDVLERCARESRGWPGVFLRLLAAAGQEPGSHRPPAWRRSRNDRVAEARRPYAGKRIPAHLGRTGPDPPRAVGRAEMLIARGRRAAAARLLRTTAAARRRRGAFAEAALLYLALVRVVWDNGDSAAAQRAASESALCAQSASDADALARAGWWLGLTALDAGSLPEAERWLGAALASAVLGRDAALAADVRLALSRCVLDRGCPGEAAGLAYRVLEEGSPRQQSGAHRRLAAIALREGAIASAGVAGARALQLAIACGDSGARRAAHVTAAAVQAAVGDMACVRHHLAKAAREAGTPRQRAALRSAIEGAPQAVCGGAGTGSAAAIRPPPRRDGTLRLASGSPDAAQREERVGGLRLGVSATGFEAYREIAEVLEICHEADEELSALRAVCALVRERLGAAAVGLYAQQAAAPLATSGREGPDDAAVARRAVESGLPVPLGRQAGGLAAATPVRYGGVAFAALALRWGPDADVDEARVDAVLAAVSTASAPHIRAAVDRAALPPPRDRDTDLGLLGTSREAACLRELVRRAAPVPFPVLIGGESGSGKELVARALHHSSPRRKGPFCAINCAALPDDLLEAELFGYARGAFTGAVVERAGVFEAARHGTLFLDEVGELSARAQAKLLRVMQEREVRRLGETVSRPVDVRIVAATNRPLHAEVRAGRFRQDLLYRLDVVGIAVPPLRARPDDVPLLVARFWQEAAGLAGTRAVLHPDTVAALCRYGWPGNVRELQNVVAALAVQAPRRGCVRPGCLPPRLLEAAAGARQSLREARSRFERRFVEAALARTNGSLSEAARELGITRQGLAKLAARLGVGMPARGAASTPERGAVGGRVQ